MSLERESRSTTETTTRADQPSGGFAALQARSHPLRASLSHEMHARKLPRLAAPARIVQFVMLVEGEDVAAGIGALESLLPATLAPPSPAARYFTCRLGALGFSWERHTEFVTYTFVAEDADGPLFDLSPFDHLARWIGGLPGKVIRSSHIRLIAGPPPTATEIAANFAPDDLVISDVAEGRARIWSDFRLHDDGFGRLLVLDRSLMGSEPSLLAQRLLELGNYRKVALLGLPVAQTATPEVTALERRLALLTGKVGDETADADALLEELSFLSAELARILAETRFRMSATRAYAELCLDRIKRLAVESVAGYDSFDDFTERRLLPAMRTCDAFSRRVEDLSQRASWTSALLRTRVDTALARRNRDLLASMDRRTALQLRLQQTVEGLSVVAISYYALGLWDHMKRALDGIVGGSRLAALDPILVPVTVILVWYTVKRLKKVGKSHE